MNIYGAAVGMVAMFPQIDSLPCAKAEPGVLKRDRKVDAGKGGSHVSRHVVGTFSGVYKKTVAVGDKTIHESFQIDSHVWVGIFLDQQRGGGVADLQGAEAILKFRARQFPLNFVGAFVEAAALSLQTDFGKDLFHCASRSRR